MPDMGFAAALNTARCARLWRAVASGAALVFACEFAVLGTLGRPFRPSLGWSLATLASIALGVAALAVARRFPARVVVAAAWAGAIAFELLYFERYHLTFDAQAAACAVRTWADIRSAVREAVPRWLLLTAGGTLAQMTLLALVELRAARISPRDRGRVAGGALVLALGLGEIASERTPEFDLLHAAFAARRPPQAIALPDVSLPVTTSTRATLPNTLFVLTESVRASDYGPQTAPRLHALLRDRERVPLAFMRSVGSYTSIALSGLYTGIHQVRPRQEILEAPTLFDFMRALRTPDGVTLRTHYFAAHLKYYLMGRELSAHQVVRLEDLTGDAEGALPETAQHGEDGLLVDRFLRELPSLGEHHFAMLHFAGTHVRYFIDPHDAPFQPWVDYVSRSEMSALHNKYLNSIHEQDKRIDEAVTAWIAAQGTKPWLIVFTSDHGEAFDEHEGIHHGQSLHAEQTHVPGFVVSGNGALDGAQLAALRAYTGEPVTHLDVIPTLLDAYGIYDSLAIAPYRGRFAGRSLLRPRVPMQLTPISNCPDWFECPIANWGVQQGELILVANYWNDHWDCANVVTRAENLISPACDELVVASRAIYPTLPNKRPNR